MSSITQALQSLLQSIKTAWLNLWQQHRKKTLITIAVLLFTAMAWINHNREYNEKLTKAQIFLTIGDYSEAKKQFEEAIKINPLYRIAAIVAIIFTDNAEKPIQELLAILELSNSARLGLRKASVFVDLSSRETISQELSQLLQRYPDDADIQTLWGKFYMSLYQFDKAQPFYDKAVQINPHISEAYAGLCEIYDLQNQLDKALKNCQQAVDIAEKSVGTAPANYVINLASIYAQQGNNDKAKQLIATLPETSPVAFELGKIHLFTNELPKAIRLQKAALNYLAEKQPSWYYKGQGYIIFLPKVEDKKCYVTYTLALTSYLKNDRKEAEKRIKATAELCKQHNEEIKKILSYDLEIAAKNSSLTKSVTGFEKKYLLKAR